jgi:hypothetical protein
MKVNAMSQKFLDELLEETYNRAHSPDLGSLRLPALTEVLLENLEDAGVITTPQLAYYRLERGNIAAEVHGYACDSEDDVLQIFFCIDATADTPLGEPAQICNAGKDLLDRAFRRMEAFVRRAQSERMEEIEESQPARELAGLVKEAQNGSHKAIELHALTTGIVSDRAAHAGAKGELRREIWDLVRLSRTCGDARGGSISIDFPVDFGTTLPCLVTPTAADGLQVLLTCIPATILAEIYNLHRASLLERNVRSFLQFTGKVNKGIRATVLNEPRRFLPYNNGLSATAGEVVVDHLPGGLGQIRIVRDFQIVNGGQTTATLASCMRRDRADLSAASVAMKLTVVPRGLLDGLVPQISRCANTQNRIQDSDFSANDPWHIAIERLSRNTWTRATSGAPRGTRWFYERSRGQYSDALASSQTPAGRRQFRSENPSFSKFTKTDLAKFILSWDQYPAVVSRGAQKCFMYFASQLAQTPRRSPEEADFKRIVALGVLFRNAEKLYSEMGFQGYRANVVTYSVARLSHECGRNIDADAIWKEQSIPDSLLNALKVIIPGVRDVITSPPSSQRNVTEWCKKDECWSAVLRRPIQVELGTSPQQQATGFLAATAPALTSEEQHLIDAVRRVLPDVWYSISAWAKRTSTLLPWQRSLAYSLGRLGGAKAPSIKQAVQGRKLLLDANRLGFVHDGLTSDLITLLENTNEAS